MGLKISTFNCGNAAPSRTPDDMLKFSAVIRGLCETGDRHPVLERWRKVAGFEEVPFDHGAGDTPIFFHPQFVTLLDYTDHVVNPHNTPVGNKGSGPSVIHPKYVTHATFRDHESHRMVHVLNNHVLASWTKGNLPPAEVKARQALGRLHIQTILDTIAPLRATVVVLGDLNATATFPLMAPLVSAVDLGSTGPTDGSRTIDYVGVRSSVVTKVDRIVIKGTSSDHDGVEADITFKPTRKRHH